MNDKKHTILIVDDEEENLDLLETTLRRGNRILKASNAEQALKHFDSEKIHMLITDQRMPGMSGTELLAAAEERFPEMIRMLITGYDDAQTAIDAINQGRVHRYASKPWNPKEIVSVVNLEFERYDLKIANIELTEDLIRTNQELVAKNKEIQEQTRKLEQMAAEYKRQKEVAVDMSNKFAQANVKLLKAQQEIREQNIKLETANKKLQHLSITDGLTDFFNHRHIHQLLDTEIGRAKRYSLKLALLMLDLDNFKIINDNKGHLFGDTVLRSVADIIKRNIRESDMPARYGGDEFLIILPHTDMQMAYKLARRIHSDILKHSFDTENHIDVTVSIGISQYPHPNIQNKDDLIRLADEAMYEAKLRGRNRISAIGVDGLEESNGNSSEALS